MDLFIKVDFLSLSINGQTGQCRSHGVFMLKFEKQKTQKNIACVLYKHVHVSYKYIVHLCSILVCINRNKYMKFHDICVGFKIYDFEISRGARKLVARDSEYVPEIELYRHDCCSQGLAHYSHVLRCT